MKRALGAETLHHFWLDLEKTSENRSSLLVLRRPDPFPEAPVERPLVEVLGVADQIYHVRKTRAKGESSPRPSRQNVWRESAQWSEATERLGRPKRPSSPVLRHTEGKTIRKIIYVPKKILNIVAN
jgi:hypothetical protein